MWDRFEAHSQLQKPRVTLGGHKDRFPVCSHLIALASTTKLGNYCVEALTAYSQKATVIFLHVGKVISFIPRS